MAVVSHDEGRLECRDLRVAYDEREVLGGVTETIRPGEWLGVVGPNGAGKSTLLRALARLVPFRGEVTIGERRTSRMSRRAFARLVAYVPQQPTFPAEMRALDYVALGRTPHHGYFGGEGEIDRRLCGELLERLSATHLAHRELGEMSGGELQRLVLARALAQEAPVLVLDEPTSALDLGRRVDALELIDEVRVERGLTVISSMHDLTLAAQFADRLMLLAQGTVVAEGTPDMVLQESVLNHFFGVGVQVLRSDEGQLVVIPRRTNPKEPRD